MGHRGILPILGAACPSLDLGHTRKRTQVPCPSRSPVFRTAYTLQAPVPKVRGQQVAHRRFCPRSCGQAARTGLVQLQQVRYKVQRSDATDCAYHGVRARRRYNTKSRQTASVMLRSSPTALADPVTLCGNPSRFFWTCTSSPVWCMEVTCKQTGSDPQQQVAEACLHGLQA